MNDDTPLFRRISRIRVREIDCPECGASVGDHCYAKGYRNGEVERRESNHMERIEAASKQLGLNPDGSTSKRFSIVNTAKTQTPTPACPARPSRWAGLEPATKEQLRAQPCPDCGAESGQPCWGKRRADGTRRPIAGQCTTARWTVAMARLGRFPTDEHS